MQETTRTKVALVTISSVEEETDLWSRGGLSGGCLGSGRGLVWCKATVRRSVVFTKTIAAPWLYSLALPIKVSLFNEKSITDHRRLLVTAACR